MHIAKLILSAAIILLLLSCQQVNRQEIWEEELIEADLAFSDMSLEAGANEAFLAFCAADAVILRENSLPVVGKASLREMMKSRDDTSFKLWWKPMHALAASSGDLGYTYGTFSMVAATGGDTLQGTYVSIWIRENDQWRWILDTGNQGLGE